MPIYRPIVKISSDSSRYMTSRLLVFLIHQNRVVKSKKSKKSASPPKNKNFVPQINNYPKIKINLRNKDI